MGNQLSQLAYSSTLTIPDHCKLYSILPINSSSEQQQMIEILQKRIKLSQCPYICTARGYDFVNEDSGTFTCSQAKKLVVYYENFQYKLTDVPIKNYGHFFHQQELCHIIRCVTSALLYLRDRGLHHGDVSLDNICKVGKVWKLVDKIFIKNGINAYEKVLQGQSGFISPKQMIRIRFGFVKESPELIEADDVFSLGMVIMQLASQVPSSLCYKEMNIRFNEEIFNQNLYRCYQTYSNQFYQLLRKMLNIEEEDRIKLDSIINNPIIRARPADTADYTAPLSLSKVKASELGYNQNNSKSSTYIHRNHNGHKPMTPVASTIPTLSLPKYSSPIVPSSSRTSVLNIRSPQQSFISTNSRPPQPQPPKPQPQFFNPNPPNSNPPNHHHHNHNNHIYTQHHPSNPSSLSNSNHSFYPPRNNLNNNTSNRLKTVN